MRPSISFCRMIPLIYLLAGLVGCSGGSDRPALTKVTGTVTYKGEPLDQGLITFYPATGRSAQGKIVKGKIQEVTTFEPDDGAPLGSHKVTIVSQENNGGDMFKTPKSLIPQKYGAIGTTDLTCNLENKPNEVRFELKD